MVLGVPPLLPFTPRFGLGAAQLGLGSFCMGLPWDLSLETSTLNVMFVGEPYLGNFLLGALALKHDLGKFGFKDWAWELPLGNFSLEALVWKL